MTPRDTKNQPTACVVALVAIIALLALAVMVSGCSPTKYVPVEIVRTEYVHADTTKLMAVINSLKEQVSRKQSQKESLVHKEKETVRLNEKGDTVWRDRFVYIHMESEERIEYEHTIENLRDSITDLKEKLTSIKVDSVPIPYPVERSLSRWEQTKMDFGGIAIGAIIAVVCIAVVWLVRKFRK